MKRLLLALSLIIAPLPAAEAFPLADGRERVSLGGRWNYIVDPMDTGIYKYHMTLQKPTKRYFAVPAETIANDESAQILWDAFTLAGTGCHLQSAKYKLKANVPTSDKNGLPLAFGVSRGVIECSIEITQCDSTAPTLTAGTGWTISQKLKCSNPDSDCPTWTATLRHFITLTVPSTSSSSS